MLWLRTSGKTTRRFPLSCFAGLPELHDVRAVDDHRAVLGLDIAERLRHARVVAEPIAPGRPVDAHAARYRAAVRQQDVDDAFGGQAVAGIELRLDRLAEQ